MQVMCVRMSKEASVAGAAWTREGGRDEVREPGGGVRVGTSSCINLQTIEGVRGKWDTIRGFQAEL